MYKKTPKSSNPNSVDSDKNTNTVSKLSTSNEIAGISDITFIDDERVDDLRLAINRGKYTINTSRVAEKFIQFETQLVT